MGKNILIFSDGTGQAGGITFDEDRTNIYKLYRASRCGPDSLVSPEDQVAFYDAGLGSPADGGFMWGKAGRWLYNLASQATGLGLTANIIDCYAALIRLYRDGDQIFLFGFSRGAYTVRCLAAVIARCGIPRTLPGGISLPLDVKGSRKLATEAVKDVYQFCSSRPREGLGWYGTFLLDTGVSRTKPMPLQNMADVRRFAVRHIFHPFCLEKFSNWTWISIAAGLHCGALFRLFMIRHAFRSISVFTFMRGRRQVGIKR